ncbi:MAG: hypothetical protein FJ161_01695 [Gammaproteobacteria bacterium]|nr:hypothetical protein [Gammaproteobacteria bacterium]
MINISTEKLSKCVGGLFLVKDSANSQDKPLSDYKYCLVFTMDDLTDSYDFEYEDKSYHLTYTLSAGHMLNELGTGIVQLSYTQRTPSDTSPAGPVAYTIWL